MNRVRFLDLAAEYRLLKPEIDAAIEGVIANSAFIGGPYVAAFEADFAAYQEAGHCIGVGNGTDALEIALQALGLRPGSEVVVPANTFIATAEAVTRAGGRVTFCDVDPHTFTMSVTDLERKVSRRTAAVIPVHLYGQPADLRAITEVTGPLGIRVIEDAAQAHGATVEGRKVGTWDLCGSFSFYPGKNLGAYGDAGCIVTNDSDLATRCRMIANHGRVEKYDHLMEGRNSRLDGIQAAVLSVKLRHLDRWIQRRREIASMYRAGLVGIPGLCLPQEIEGRKHVYHLFVVRSARRDALRQFLSERGIDTGIHYPIALHKLAAYAGHAQSAEEMVSSRLGSEVLSLPMGPRMEDGEVAQVIEEVRAFYSC